MIIDLETLLVFGAAIPALMGLVAMGVGGSLHERDRALMLWGAAMLLAGFNQAVLLTTHSTPWGIVLANATFVGWVVIGTIAVGRASGRVPPVTPLVLWALASWLVFAACVFSGELRLGRLLSWPNIILMLLIALHWALSDRRKRMPLARGLLLGGLAMTAGAILFRTVMLALGDERALLIMESESTISTVFLSTIILGLVLATLGMLLTSMDGVNRKLRFALDVDALTRLATRHAFFETANRLPPGATRALMMVDADHFKSINDRFGHATGDAVLRHLGGVLREALPAGCLVARIGGEGQGEEGAAQAHGVVTSR
jgi:hypothetical protein